MPYAVELELDARAIAAVDRLSRRLESELSIETVRQLGAAPHISLAIYDDLHVDAFLPRLAAFAGEVRPIPVPLASLGIFPGAASVIFVAPVVSDGLLALHRHYHKAFADHDAAAWGHYRPGFWVPHVTLAMDLDLPMASRAVASLTAGWKVIAADVAAIGLIRFRPVEIVHRIPLFG